MVGEQEAQVFENVGIILIGRNEGERLRRSIESALNKAQLIVYVDSDSTDGSVEVAQSYGVHVVNLDMSIPFSAARARNEGVAYMKQQASKKIEFIQFIDGDCELAPNWISTAVNFLTDNEDFVVVCGRRREKFPEDSIYNYLTDVEWDTPIGETIACGGDALMRLAAFDKAGGFRNDLIAGEEPELCVRLRENNGKIMRFDAEMTLHDAAITKFSQWWKRSVRAGYAFALGAYIHGSKKEKFRVKQRNRSVFWAGILPVVILLASFLTAPYALLVFVIYPLQVLRISMKSGLERHNYFFGLFMMIAKFSEFKGILMFWRDRFLGKKTAILEYKG